MAASASRRSNKVFADNHPSLWWFFNKVKRLWLAALKRRSQTARLSWERFIQFVARFFPPIVTISLIYIGPFLNRSKFAEQLDCAGVYFFKSHWMFLDGQRGSRREGSPGSTRPDKLKVLVCGGRDFDDRAAVYAKLDRLHADRPFRAVIAGGARGADTLAIEWANQGSRCPF